MKDGPVKAWVSDRILDLESGIKHAQQKMDGLIAMNATTLRQYPHASQMCGSPTFQAAERQSQLIRESEALIKVLRDHINSEGT